VASALVTHRARGTLTETVDAFAAGSPFTASKLREAGLPGDRIFVKPNFLAPDPGTGSGNGGYAVYLGRLSPEKGISTLLEAWDHLDDRVPLRIAGTGPLRHEVERFASTRPHVDYLGFASDEDLDKTIKNAALLVLPSVNYEGFPKTIVEALSRGTPVIASRLGAMQDAISPGVTGEHFVAGDPGDLAAVVAKLTDDPATLQSMRTAARSAYLDRYTPERNYAIMMEIYRFARERRHPSDEGEQ
jgi:glycosyltransferase involved in cell wall biosynthesis